MPGADKSSPSFTNSARMNCRARLTHRRILENLRVLGLQASFLGCLGQPSRTSIPYRGQRRAPRARTSLLGPCPGATEAHLSLSAAASQQLWDSEG